MLRTDWNPISETVERRLEGCKAKLLSRGRRLVLLRSILAAISIFHLSVFKLPIRVRKRLEGLMKRFLWKRSRPEQGRGQALIA